MDSDALLGDLMGLASTNPNRAKKAKEYPSKYDKKQAKFTRGLKTIVASEATLVKKPPKKLTLRLTKRGMMVSLAALLDVLTMDQYDKLQRALTHTYVSQVGKKTLGKLTMRLFQIHTITNEGQIRRIFACSRFCGIVRILKEICTRYELQITVLNEVSQGLPIPPNRNTCNIKLTDNQQLVIDYLMTNIFNDDRVRKGSSGCVFIMATGDGKSYVSSYLIHKLRVKTLLVIPSESIMTGWMDLFAKYLPGLTIGQYYGKVKTDGDVVLGVINSLLGNEFVVDGKKIPWSDYFNRFGLVVYDEIHNYPTAGRQEIFWRGGCRRLFGMTATPSERADAMDVIYTKHIGPLVHAPEIPGYNVKEIEWQGEVKVIQYKGPPEHTERITGAMGTTQVSSMHKQFCADPYRNNLIIREILELQAAGMDVFCFSEHREYLEYLYALLQEHNLKAAAPELGILQDGPQDGEKPKTIAGSVSKLMGGAGAAEHKMAHASQILLVTYAYAKEGISIVKMNGMIFTTPRKSKMRQIIGRILRRGGDPSIVRKIVDIVDVGTTLKSQYPMREAVYQEKKFTIKVVKVGWKELV